MGNGIAPATVYELPPAKHNTALLKLFKIAKALCIQNRYAPNFFKESAYLNTLIETAE